MKVFLNSYPWHVSPRNTDWLQYRNFIDMSARHTDVEFLLPKSLLASVSPNYAYLRNAFSRKLGLNSLTDFVWSPIHENIIYRPEMDRFHPDVIYSHGHFPKNAGGVPVIFATGFVPKGDPLIADRSDEWLNRHTAENYRLSRKAAIVSLHTHTATKLMQDAMPDIAGKIRTLPFYRPYITASKEERIRQKHHNCDCLQILLVGSMANRKGLPLLIAAIERVHQWKRNAVHLHVVSGFQDGAIEIPKDLPITSHGALPTGATQQLFDLCHVYAMPSKKESFGISFIEALAHGCVVIGPDYAVQREILDDGRAGFLVPPDNVNQLVEVLKHLIEHPEERLNKALVGHLRYRTEYHWEAVEKMYIQAFQDATNM